MVGAVAISTGSNASLFVVYADGKVIIVCSIFIPLVVFDTTITPSNTMFGIPMHLATY